MEVRTIRFEFLDAEFELAAEEFQSGWENMAEGGRMARAVTPRGQALDVDELGEMLALWRVFVLASGEEEGVKKLYVYSRFSANLLLAEVNLDPPVLSLLGKAED